MSLLRKSINPTNITVSSLLEGSCVKKSIDPGLEGVSIGCNSPGFPPTCDSLIIQVGNVETYKHFPQPISSLLATRIAFEANAKFSQNHSEDFPSESGGCIELLILIETITLFFAVSLEIPNLLPP